MFFASCFFSFFVFMCVDFFVFRFSLFFMSPFFLFFVFVMNSNALIQNEIRVNRKSTHVEIQYVDGTFPFLFNGEMQCTTDCTG